MGKNTNRNIAIVVIVGLVLLLAYNGGYLDEWLPDTGSVYTGERAPQKFILYKRGTVTELADATVYAAFDWNDNEMIDLGEFPDGEIETLTSATTTGLVTTGLDYPVGLPVYYQVHLATYEVETFTRQRDSLPSAYDGSALTVPACYITLTDTGATRISINGELLVTSSTDYNWSLSGSEPSCEVVHTSTTTDTGINEQAYTNWGTGVQYAGTMLIITYLSQDFVDLHPDGYSGFFPGATVTTVWYDVEGYFNDAGFTGDERYSVFFNLDITADGDMATIGFYNGIELTDLAIGVLNTQLGTYEDNIDIDDGF